jgi:hypothetical protein
MSQFVTECDVRVLDDGGPRPTIRLLSPLVYESDLLEQVITVPEGFHCDGASIPRAAMSITGWPGLRAAVVHDWLVRTTLKRRYADEVFHEALRACGVEEQTADTMFYAVRVYSELLA